MPTNYLTFCEFLQCWRDLSACTPSASSIGSANCRSPAFSELPLRPAKHFSRDLVYSLHHLPSVSPSFARSVCHIIVDPASVPIQQLGGVSSDSPFLPDGPKPLSLLAAIAQTKSRGCFPSPLLCRFAQCSDIICSLFFLVTTLSKRRTPRPCTSNAHVAGTLDGAS